MQSQISSDCVIVHLLWRLFIVCLLFMMVTAGSKTKEDYILRLQASKKNAKFLIDQLWVFLVKISRRIRISVRFGQVPWVLRGFMLCLEKTCQLVFRRDTLRILTLKRCPSLANVDKISQHFSKFSNLKLHFGGWFRGLLVPSIYWGIIQN